MKILHTLIGFLFLSLQDNKHTGVVDAMNVYTGTTGGDVTVNCSNSRLDILKFFCRQKCEEKDILIRTTAVRGQRGRFSIEWKNKGKEKTTGEVFVTIRQLTKSDSGLYRCGFNQSGRSSHVDVRIIVVDALLDGTHPEDNHILARTGGNIVAACYLSFSSKWKYFCREECHRQNVLVDTTGDRVQKGRYAIEYVGGTSSGGILYVSISQLTESDSGRYRCRPDRLFLEDVYQEFTVTVTDDLITSKPNFPASTSPQPGVTASETLTGVVMYVRAAVIMSIIVGLVLMIVYVQRSSKLRGSRSRRHAGQTNMEISVYEICQPASPCEDSDYQSLNPASRDQDQTCNHTHTPHTPEADSNVDSAAES